MSSRKEEQRSDPVWIRLSLASAIVCLSILVLYLVRPAAFRQGMPPEDLRPVVCIDPGHPTRTNRGVRVRHGVTELDMNWQVALKLESILKQIDGVRVIKTRDVRYKVMDNSARAMIANKARAAITVHLHCDVGANHGFTIYYPDRQATQHGTTGPSAEVIAQSRWAAQAMHRAMKQTLGGLLKDRGIKTDGSTKYGRRLGALSSSIYSEVPTLTIEMVFLNNSYDAQFISSRDGQEMMAGALARGVMRFLDQRRNSSGT